VCVARCLPNDPGFNPRGFTRQGCRMPPPKRKRAAISRHLQGTPQQGEAVPAPPGSNPCWAGPYSERLGRASASSSTLQSGSGWRTRKGLGRRNASGRLNKEWRRSRLEATAFGPACARQCACLCCLNGDACDRGARVGSHSGSDARVLGQEATSRDSSLGQSCRGVRWLFRASFGVHWSHHCVRFALMRRAGNRGGTVPVTSR